MSYTPSQLERLQRDVAARLEANSFFADIGVFIMRPRDNDGFVQIQGRADQLLAGMVKKAGKAGVAVFVLMPTADATDLDAPGPRLDNTITVRVQELPAINMGPNGTLKSCEEVALQVLQVCHHFNPGKGNVIYAAPDAITPSAVADPKVTIDVKLLQKSGLAYYRKCAPVTISAVGLVVTLSCTEVGATILYSIDGSYPTLAYTAPFTLAAAATVRAAAHTADLQQSDLRESSIS